MADTKTTALDPLVPDYQDITYVVDDPSGTPVGKKSTVQNLVKGGASQGAVSALIDANLTVSKVLVSDASGKVSASSVTSTTLSYVDPTSSIQTQLNGKEPANANIQSHISSTANPHSVTKAQVGLTNVTDNAQVKKISSSTDNAIIRWDGTTGDTPQDSAITIDDNAFLNGWAGLAQTLTAGENVAAGDLCYFKASDGKYWKADADAAATSTTELRLALATISADATGSFLAYGTYTTTGLTAGTQYVSGTLGAITATAPTGTDKIVRIVGNARSTTVLFFNPDSTYITLA